MSESIIEQCASWAVIWLAFIVIMGIAYVCSKLMPTIVRGIVNFIKWQRFRKKDIFEDFDDLYED